MAERSRNIRNQAAKGAKERKRRPRGEAVPKSVQQRAAAPQSSASLPRPRPLPGPDPRPPGPWELLGARRGPPSDSKGSAEREGGGAVGGVGQGKKGEPARRGCPGARCGCLQWGQVCWGAARLRRKSQRESELEVRSPGGRLPGEGPGVGGGRGCRMSVGLPGAARFAAPGRRLLTQALPPASLPASSQTQPRVPISTPTPANDGCTPRLEPASAIQPSASQLQSGRGWGGGPP